MCQLPSEPGHGDDLNEEAYPRGKRSDGIDAKIPIGEGMTDAAEAAFERPAHLRHYEATLETR